MRGRCALEDQRHESKSSMACAPSFPNFPLGGRAGRERGAIAPPANAGRDLRLTTGGAFQFGISPTRTDSIS